MAAILTHTTDFNYASSATLQLLEQELDELRRARQARRLSMLSGQSPSPPPQFKAARRNSDVPSRESTPERRKPPVKLKESISSPSIQTSVSDSIKEFEELPRNSLQIADKPNMSTEKFDPIEPSDDTALIINKVPVLVSPKKEECENTALPDTSEEEPLTPEVTIKEEESSENCDLVKMHDYASTTAILEPLVTKSKETKEESNPAEAVDQTEEDTESVETLGEISPVIKTVLPESKDDNNEKPTQPMALNLQSAEHKSRAIQRERKPFRIQTTFEQDQTHENQESAILLNAIRNLKSSAPSPPPAAIALSPSKSTSALYKLMDKRASFQSSQVPSNDFRRKQRPNDRKPRPLSDAFIGVKGLSKRFDSTESFRSKEKPLLSPESQSVSRQRRISAPTKPAISALSQIFANNEAKPPVRPARQSKPLPPIKVDELAKRKQVKKSIPPQKNESLRLLHKTMPAIPIEATTGYPNPLPVYTPQLVHPIGEVMKEETENNIDETKTPKESIDETKCHRKRVSFSTVVTTIPPPSPSQYSDDDNHESQRKQPAIMSSANLLSRWQQQHQMDREMPTRGKNDTRGFWEAFSTEMNNRAAPDLRRMARDPPSQQMNSQSRFIPTTFGNKPLPAVSNDKPIQEASMRKNKTWINALQDRLAMKTSSETLNEAKPVQNSYRTSVTSRKPVNQVSFTDSALPRSNTPPLHHPTKNRPKKPSSFRKHTLQGQRSNIVGSEVSVPPPAVQRPWYRNH